MLFRTSTVNVNLHLSLPNLCHWFYVGGVPSPRKKLQYVRLLIAFDCYLLYKRRSNSGRGQDELVLESSLSTCFPVLHKNSKRKSTTTMMQRCSTLNANIYGAVTACRKRSGEPGCSTLACEKRKQVVQLC